MSERDADDRFRIVFMCTGNQARSVIAEHYTRNIASGLPVVTESVGLLDAGGAPALAEAIATGQELGLDLSAHASRHFGATDLSHADLVIGFEQQHVAAAVVDGNAPSDRAFRLPELVRLLADSGASGGDSAEAARAAVARVAAHRASDDRFRPGEDIADPIGQDSGFFRRTAREIQSGCDQVIGALFGARPTG